MACLHCKVVVRDIHQHTRGLADKTVWPCCIAANNAYREFLRPRIRLLDDRAFGMRVDFRGISTSEATHELVKLHHIPAFQVLQTRPAAARFLKPTRLVLQDLFAANTALFNQERAFGALHIIWVALMLNLGMVARRSRPSARKPTLGRLGTTLEYKVSNCYTWDW